MQSRWKTSNELLERARQSLAGGVSSPFRAKFPVPLYFAGGAGSRLEDEDGNRYIDYTLAWGPLILGHCHPAIVEAVSGAARRPHIYGAEHRLEYEVAERIQSMVPCAERVAFTSSGSEAVQLALRLARAYTGRELVLKFEGHYHGWLDSVLLSHHPEAGDVGPFEAPRVVAESRGQVRNAADNVIVLPWNHPDLVEDLLARRGADIAAVIMEPVLSNSGGILPAPGYHQRVRELTRRHGVLLVFDEIITGFRLHAGGAQTHYGVTPDLATFGKAVAGGPPLSVITGRKEIMEQIAGGGVSFGGTFNGNPLSLAAARATLDELSRDGGRPLAEANRRGQLLQDGIAAAAREHGVALLTSGFGAAFSVHFTRRNELRHYRDTFDDDRALLGRFLRLMLGEGIYLLPDGRLYTSVVHTDADISETVAAASRVLGKLAAEEA